ncbi:hypothetical protein ACFRFL_27460 [Streptomyces sp. NPDC056708]
MWSLYRTAGPLDSVDIPAPLGGIIFTPGRDLVSCQYGYRSRGDDGHRLDGWPEEWGPSPATRQIRLSPTPTVPGTRVGIAIHGAGSWKPFWVAPTPTDFMMLLACFTQAYVVECLNRPDGDEAEDESRPPACHNRVAVLLRDRAPEVDAAAFLDHLCQ